MQSLSDTLDGLSGEDQHPDHVLRTETAPRGDDLYPRRPAQHLGQLVAYARMNTIVPPWTIKG